jgi:polysaccharide biosynthesis/export protein
MSFYIHPPRFYYTNKYIFSLFLSGFALFLFASCSSTKNSYYFKTLPRDTSITNTVNRVPETRIQKNDQLSINISSLNPAEDAVFNAAAGMGGATVLSGGSPSGYTVDVAGNIQVHRLGIIHAEGMTRRELKNKLETDISPYLKDPVVTIRFLNHRVTLLGEVATPQVITMPEEQLSLLEVLGSSGDITQLAKRDNILIIREKENSKQFKRINLEDHSIFTSEWYYLQPGDVVYVEPNDKRIKDEKRARQQQTISFALSGISLAIIILDRILR